MWQPIETAPKGKLFLAFQMHDYGPGVGVHPRMWICHWWPGDSLNPASWADGCLPARPTHWMPLPDPPPAEPKADA